MSTKHFNFFSIFFCTFSFLVHASSPLEIEFEVLTDEMIKKNHSDLYTLIGDYEVGHYKTVVWSSQDTSGPIRVEIHRPLTFSEEPKIFYIDQESLDNQKSSGIHKPILLIVASKGYLPGEVAEFKFFDKNGNKVQEKKHIPLPFGVRSTIDGADIALELLSLKPTFYDVTFSGFQEDEKINFASNSQFESFEKKAGILKNTHIAYAPGVVGFEGGIAKLTITRPLKDRLVLQVPWGDSFEPYFNGHINVPRGKPIIRN